MFYYTALLKNIPFTGLKRVSAILCFLFLYFISIGTTSAQINLTNGNTLQLNSSNNLMYLETRIFFKTGIYKADDYCWNKISDSVDSRWLITSCFNGDCRNDLLPSGCFVKDFGFNDTLCFLGFHVETHDFDGRSVIRYQIINKNNNTDKTDLVFDISFKNTLGITSINQNKSITVFPNPVKEQLLLQSIKPFDEAKIQFMNSLGQLVLEQHITEFRPVIADVSSLSKGIYFLRFMPTVINLRRKEAETEVFILKFIKE